VNCREKLKVVRLIHLVSVLINVVGVEGVEDLTNEKHKSILNHTEQREHRVKSIMLKLFFSVYDTQHSMLSAVINL
jgi:hypothetical protein